jgi:hypothetical protein
VRATRTIPIYFAYLLVLLLVSDLIMGLVYIPKDAGIRVKDPFYHHGYKPNKKVMVKWGESRYLLVSNSLGLRDSSTRNVDLTSNAYRIVFIGDSFTEGMGLPYEQTFTGLISDGEKNKGVEIFNAGMVSYSPKLYYLKVKYLLEIGFKFDELYVLPDISDVQDEIIYQDFVPEELVASKGPIGRGLEYFTNEILFSKSYYFRLFRGSREGESAGASNIWVSEQDYVKARSAWLTDANEYGRWGRLGLLLAKKHMLKLYELCERRGIKMNLVVYPWPEQIKAGNLDSVWVEQWREFCGDKKINFINLFPDFINSRSKDILKSYFIENDVHWSAEGHKYVAKQLIEKAKAAGSRL